MKKTIQLVALTAALLLGSLPVDADEPPFVTDAGGDANGLNSQGILDGFQSGPDVRPASIDSADITKVRFSTEYYSTNHRKADGSLVIMHQATGLKIHFTTSAPAAPTFGPTLVFRVPATIPLATGTCDVFFQAWVSGPGSVPAIPPASPGDTPQRADIRTLTTNCPRAVGTGTSTVTEGFSLNFAGNEMTLSYPFTASGFNGGLAKFLGVGVSVNPQALFINANNAPHVRPLLGTAATAPTIDETPRIGAFVIGSDVPPDVDCGVAPDDPQCPAPPAA